MVLAVLLTGLLSACGIGTRTQALMGGKLRVHVHVSEEVNQHSPVALDLLLVYDKRLLKELANMPASEWFAKRRQFQMDYPHGKGFEVCQWEWVPGQNVPILKLPLKAQAKGGLIFANYFSPGEHRARIEPTRSIHIDLLEDAFTVEPLNRSVKGQAKTVRCGS